MPLYPSPYPLAAEAYRAIEAVTGAIGKASRHLHHARVRRLHVERRLRVDPKRSRSTATPVRLLLVDNPYARSYHVSYTHLEHIMVNATPIPSTFPSQEWGHLVIPRLQSLLTTMGHGAIQGLKRRPEVALTFGAGAIVSQQFVCERYETCMVQSTPQGRAASPRVIAQPPPKSPFGGMWHKTEAP